MNQYNPYIHHRRSIRLSGYDYSQHGLYFITLCVHKRLPLFGTIKSGIMRLSPCGIIANECWAAISNEFSNTFLHEFVVMPNHIHGIIEIGITSSGKDAINRAPTAEIPTVGESVGTRFIASHNTGVASEKGAINRAPTVEIPTVGESVGTRFIASHNTGAATGKGAINRAPTEIPTAAVGGFAGAMNPMFHMNLA